MTTKPQAAILLSLLVSVSVAAQTKRPVVWMESSLVRIPMSGVAGTAEQITIHAAKGESESFQIAVQTPTPEPLTNVQLTAEDFGGKSGVIAKSNVVLYREHFIVIEEADKSVPVNDGTPVTNPPLGAGTYADALILQPFGKSLPYAIETRYTQPFWVDVNVPRTAAAGAYATRFTVKSDQGETTVIANLVVWNFALPVQPALKSAFLMEVETKELKELLLRHRLMPKDVPGTDERQLIDDLGLNIASFHCNGGMDANKQPLTPEKYKAEAAKHERELPLYCYSADEISCQLPSYDTLKTWASEMHPYGIDQLVTMVPDPRLFCDRPGCEGESRRSAVDIWVVLPFQYDRWTELCRYAQRKGDEVWSYNALVQDNFSPKWHIDFAPINFRIQPGFITQSLGLTGLLYWRVDYWKTRQEAVWRDAKRDPFPKVPNDKVYPGDGVMVYPPTKDIAGLSPSMRLKWLRDGVDDFDYLEMLKKSGRTELAMAIARRVGADWRNWTRDPRVLEAARLEIGYALSAGTPAPPCPKP